MVLIATEAWSTPIRRLHLPEPTRHVDSTRQTGQVVTASNAVGPPVCGNNPATSVRYCSATAERTLGDVAGIIAAGTGRTFPWFLPDHLFAPERTENPAQAPVRACAIIKII